MAAPDGLKWVLRATIEERLQDWAREYSGPITIGRGGAHILARLIEFGGFLPGSTAPRNQVARTAADEIEDYVRRLEKAYPGNAAVLRYEYFHPDMAMENRLGFLRADGLEVTRTGYYERLNQAKHFIAGALLGARDLRPD